MSVLRCQRKEKQLCFGGIWRVRVAVEHMLQRETGASVRVEVGRWGQDTVMGPIPTTMYILNKSF